MSCHVYAFLTILFWASAYIGTKIATASFGAGPLGLIRCGMAAVILGVVVFARGGGRLPKRGLFRMVLSGLTGLALYLVLINRGAVSIGPTTSSVIIATTPIVTAVLARLFFRERVRALGALGMAMAFGGILIMSLWEGTLDINPGIAWTAAGAVSLGVFNILQRSLSRDFSALDITVYSFFAAAVLLLPYLPETMAELRRAPLEHTLIACYMGVFPSAVSYLCWAKAMSLAADTSQVANYMFLTPFLALVMEFAIMVRFPDAATIVGGVLILGGLAVFRFAGRK